MQVLSKMEDVSEKYSCQDECHEKKIAPRSERKVGFLFPGKYGGSSIRSPFWTCHWNGAEQMIGLTR